MINEKYKTFEEFVQNYLTEEVIYTNRMFWPQSLYIFNGDVCMVDKIFNIDEISNSVEFKSILGVKELEEINNTNNIVKKQVSPSASAKIKELYKIDYNLLGF